MIGLWLVGTCETFTTQKKDSVYKNFKNVTSFQKAKGPAVAGGAFVSVNH
jgi:hypothetical protein